MYKQETRRLRSFLWRMRHFLYFFSYIFNKNKEDCIFLINISCFGGFLLRKVQKSWFWKTILWLNLWLKLWLNSGFVLKLRHRLGRVTHLYTTYVALERQWLVPLAFYFVQRVERIVWDFGPGPLYRQAFVGRHNLQVNFNFHLTRLYGVGDQPQVFHTCQFFQHTKHKPCALVHAVKPRSLHQTTWTFFSLFQM